MITMTMDFSEFDKRFSEKVRISSRTFKENVNRGALDLAFRALANTFKADPGLIRRLPMTLGKTAEGSSIWYAHIRKLLGRGFTFTQKRKGIKRSVTISGPGTRSAISRVSRKVLASRVRGVSFLKSGWLPAIRKLDALVREKVRGANFGGARQFGPDRGHANPATSELNPVAEIFNSAFKSEKALAIGAKGMQDAIDAAAKDMEKHIADKMREIWNGR